jgi:hypothetical protein
MKIKLFLTIIFALKIFHSFAQPQILEDEKNKKVKLSLAFSLGRSTFHVQNVSESPQYPTLELRMGIGFSKPIGKRIEIQSGVNFGLKFKRETYFFGPAKQFTTEPYVLLGLDETASERNHMVAEFPLLLQYKPKRSNFSAKSGLYSRFWQPTNTNTDYLSSFNEFGILNGVKYRISKKLNLSIDYYYGLSDFYKGTILINGSQYRKFKATNRFIQTTIEFAINRKKIK